MHNQTGFPSLPSYAEALNPENASEYPVLSCVLVSHFPTTDLTHAAQLRCGSNQVVWEFQSLSGAFKTFSVEVSNMLEAALIYGLSTYEIPERHWFFNLKELSQSSSLVMYRCACSSCVLGLMVSAVKMEKKHSETAIHLRTLSAYFLCVEHESFHTDLDDAINDTIRHAFCYRGNV